jgi:ABC-type uncharacterized transport system substrate-binding protein
MEKRTMKNGIKGLAFLALTAVLIIGGQAIAAEKKKVFFIDSYHEGYEWSDGIVQGVRSVFGDQIELNIHRMDTKNNPSEEFARNAGDEVRQAIEAWGPAVVIAADDNASRHVVAPFYADTELPVVFCGVNWDASVYGFPTKNVCGMEEVALIAPLLQQLKSFAKGERIGYISADTVTTRKEAEYIQKIFGIDFEMEVYATAVSEWETQFKELQGAVDMLIIGNAAGITDWSDPDAVQFVREESRIPSGCIHDFMAPYALVGYTKVAEEQGEWAAAAALRILNGERPESIGVVQNKKGNLYVNLPIATKLGIRFPLNVLKNAKVIRN